jgi:hypothetical protein
MQYDPIKFTTTGGLPTGIAAGTTYYAMSSGHLVPDFGGAGRYGDQYLRNAVGTRTGINAPHGCSNDAEFQCPQHARPLCLGLGWWSNCRANTTLLRARRFEGGAAASSGRSGDP